MSNSKQKYDRPLYRVSFARFTGHDDQGNEIVGSPKEIGAIWPRKNGKAGGILQFDIIPIELTKRQGVMFVVPVDQEAE